MVKDRNRPKGAMSAYASFVQTNRQEHKTKHPHQQVVFSEFSRTCADKWKKMTPKNKQRFHSMAATDKDRYQREMAEYKPNIPTTENIQPEVPINRKRTKDCNSPKRAWSSYFFFCDEFRPHIRKQHPDFSMGDVAKELGKMWKAQTDKSKYEKKALSDKRRYEREMAQYRNDDNSPLAKRSKPNSIAVAGPSTSR